MLRRGKPELIHFTKKKSEQTKGRLVMQDAAIEPSATAKLLGGFSAN